MLKHVKEKYKTTREALDSLGVDQGMCSESRHSPKDVAVYISEPGLYSLILRSKMKEAEDFQDWVVGTLLPEIRAGSYKSIKPQSKLQICLLNEFDLHAKVIDFVRRFYPEANIVAGLGKNQDSSDKRIKAGNVAIPRVNATFCSSTNTKNGREWP